MHASLGSAGEWKQPGKASLFKVLQQGREECLWVFKHLGHLDVASLHLLVHAMQSIDKELQLMVPFQHAACRRRRRRRRMRKVWVWQGLRVRAHAAIKQQQQLLLQLTYLLSLAAVTSSHCRFNCFDTRDTAQRMRRARIVSTADN